MLHNFQFSIMVTEASSDTLRSWAIMEMSLIRKRKWGLLFFFKVYPITKLKLKRNHIYMLLVRKRQDIKKHINNEKL